MSPVMHIFKKSLAQKKFIIIDACQSGSKIGRSSSFVMSRSFQEEMCSNSEGLAILTSCKNGQASYEYPEKNHGVFSYYLLEGLKGEADTDKDCIITVPDANNYVSKKMREWSLNTGNEQNPYFSYEVVGDFIFVRIPKLTVDKNLTVTIKPLKFSERVNQIIEDLALMSFFEVLDSTHLLDELREYFGRSDGVISRINELDELRDTIAHNRIISSFDYNSLKTLHGEILGCLDKKN